MKLISAFGLLLVATWLFVNTTVANADKLKIVATIGMIGDVVENIAGERADVYTLMGTGIDPHSYRQTRSDIVRLGQADIIFSNGLYLEAQLEELLEKLSQRQRVVFLGNEIEQSRLLVSPIYQEKFDPHIWMDVSLWSQVTELIRDTLVNFDPNARAYFQSNASNYLSKLDKLNSYVYSVIDTIPANERIVVTAHDAFSYFGRAYNIDVVGIQGISTESEAGLNRISELVELIVERKLKAVFIESTVSERNVKALIEGSAARGHEVVIGGELFSDAMGAPGTYEGTYIGMIIHNATKITQALGGTVPLSGMNN